MDLLIDKVIGDYRGPDHLQCFGPPAAWNQSPPCRMLSGFGPVLLHCRFYVILVDRCLVSLFSQLYNYSLQLTCRLNA